jgi:manganese transport protein
LIHFTRDRRKMGPCATPAWANAAAWAVAGIIIALNIKLIIETIREGVAAGSVFVQYLLIPATLVALPLLIWMVIEPFWREWQVRRYVPVPTPALPPLELSTLSGQFRRIGVALEVRATDQEILASVVPLARASGAELVLMHAVESGAARFLGAAVQDEEARGDRDYLDRVTAMLRQNGLICTARIGAGEPEDELARLAREENLDLIVTGSHGHHWLGDFFHGSTVSELRHKTRIPVFTIRLEGRS